MGIIIQMLGAYFLTLRENYSHYTALGATGEDGVFANPNFAGEAPPPAAPARGPSSTRFNDVDSDSSLTDDDAADLRAGAAIPPSDLDSDVYSDDGGRSSGDDAAVIPVNAV